MKKRRAYLQILIFSLGISCSTPKPNPQPLVSPNEIVKNLMSWLYYERDQLDLYGEYISLDTSSNEISKDEFLRHLSTGMFIPVKLDIKDSISHYRLYLVENGVDHQIKDVIKNKFALLYQYFKLEGQKLPDFDFVDLKNNRYDLKAFSGKFIVINCWFIHCLPCVKEIPELNQLVDMYAEGNDILFLALAFDHLKDLVDFLHITDFKYRVIPDQEDYLANTLKIQSYPTHILVNRDGVIIKIIDGNFEKFKKLLKKSVESA